MLKAIKPKKAKIKGIIKLDSGLRLLTENGTLQLEVYNERIIRVRYTLEKEFSSEVKLGINKEIHSKEVNYKETLDDDKSNVMYSWSYELKDQIIEIKTHQIRLAISRETSALTFYDAENNQLFKEISREGKVLIPYDSYKTIINENSSVKRIKTPDGIKEIISNKEEVFDRILYHSRLSFEFSEEEAIYGFGQQEEGCLNLRGTRQYIHQANLKIAMPFFVSTNGYGLLMDTYSPLIFNDDEYGSYIHNESCEELDYYFVRGDTLDEVIKGYREITGKAALLPKWAFGFMQSKERYETQDEIIDTVKRYRDSRVPLDSIVLDWHSWEGDMWGQKSFDKIRFPNPKGMMEQLHEMNVRFMISIWPNMNRESDNYKEFDEAKATLPMSEIYDPFRQEGRDLYWKQAYDGLFKYGLDAWWCDSSEPFCPEWQQYIKPDSGHNYMEFHNVAKTYINELYTNAFPLMHAKTMYEGQRSVTQDKRVVNLTRSGYTGQQKYGTVLWSGDISANWKTLKNQIPAGLNLCASGLPFWTLDIGAFFVKQGERWFWNGDYEDGCNDLGYRELYTRFYQLGTFLPIFRSHGTDTSREIWNFGEPGTLFYDSIERFTKLRYEIMPYIYSLVGNVYLKDKTMLRLLAFDFPKDKKVFNCKDQFMFGENILVCPVTEPMYFESESVPLEYVKKSRMVYLPEGVSWFDFWTGEQYEGGQTIPADAPIDKMPLYIKAGSIIPMSIGGQNTDECDDSQLIIKVYPGKNGEFTLYQDSGDGYEYEDSEYSTVELTWEEESKTLIVSDRKGSYAKMPAVISIRLEVQNLNQLKVVEFSYNGTKALIDIREE